LSAAYARNMSLADDQPCAAHLPRVLALGFALVSAASAFSQEPAIEIDATAVEWEGEAVQIIPLKSEGPYGEQFRQNLGVEIERLFLLFIVNDLPIREPSFFGLPTSPDRSDLEDFKDFARAIIKKAAEEFSAAEADFQLDGVDWDFVLRATGTATPNRGAPNTVGLSNPEVHFDEEPGTFERAATVTFHAPEALPAIAVQLPESQGSSDFFRDASRSELRGKPEPARGHVWRILDPKEIRISFEGTVTRTLKARGEAKFGGVGSSGRARLQALPIHGRVDVFDRWTVEWVYHGIFELELPYGKVDTSVRGAAVNRSRVFIRGGMPDAFQVWIEAP